MHFANLFLWLSLVYGFGVLAVFLFLLVRGIYFGFVILFTCGAIFNCLSRILFCLVRPEEDSFLQLRPIILSVASGLAFWPCSYFSADSPRWPRFSFEIQIDYTARGEIMNDSQFLPGALIVPGLARFAALPAAFSKVVE